jgi:predicted MFS family arabinose efflux permease
MTIQLRRGLGIGETQIGLLLTASFLVGAVATLPFGWLVDRTNRTRVLALTVVLWGVAMGLSAAATSYLELLLTRLALGAMIAVAVPAVASLVGDYFPPQRRGRIYGYILAGELLGIGFGYVVSGELALLSWRLGFLGLALPAFWVAWLVHRLPEPARGGVDWLEPGQEQIGARRRAGSPEGGHNADVLDTSGLIHDLIQEAHIQPRPRLVGPENPARQSLLWAAWYILRIPTNVVLVIASALGYFFFAGMQTFGVVFAHGWFGLAHSAAIGLVLLFGVSGLVGALVGGRLGDHLLSRGHLSARITVVTLAYGRRSFSWCSSRSTRCWLPCRPSCSPASAWGLPIRPWTPHVWTSCTPICGDGRKRSVSRCAKAARRWDRSSSATWRNTSSAAARSVCSGLFW